MRTPVAFTIAAARSLRSLPLRLLYAQSREPTRPTIARAIVVLSAAFMSALLLAACQKAPEEVVSEGMRALAAVSQYQMEVALDGVGIAPEGELPARVDFDVKIAGYIDSSDPKSQISDMALDAAVTLDQDIGSVGVAMRSLGDVFYLKLSKLDIPQLAALFPPEVMSQFTNQWWLVPKTDESGYYAEILAEQRVLQEKLKEINVFRDIQFVGEEAILGEKMDRFSVVLDKEAFLELVVAIAEAGGNTLIEGERSALAERLKEVDFVGDVWVAQSDGAVRQIAGTVKSLPAAGGSFEVDLRASFSELGVTQTVAAPEGAQEFDPSLLFNLGGGLLPGGLTPVLPEGGVPIDSPLGAEQLNIGELIEGSELNIDDLQLAP